MNTAMHLRSSCVESRKLQTGMCILWAGGEMFRPVGIVCRWTKMWGHLLILHLFVVASGTLSCMCSMADWCCELDCKQSGTFSRHDSVYSGCFQTSPLLYDGKWWPILKVVAGTLPRGRSIPNLSTYIFIMVTTNHKWLWNWPQTTTS